MRSTFSLLWTLLVGVLLAGSLIAADGRPRGGPGGMRGGREGPGSPPECVLECQREAAAAVRDALENGATREECREIHDDIFQACMDENPDCEMPEPPERPEYCFRQCREEAAAAVQDCLVDEGADEETCRALYEQALQDCLERNQCEPPERPCRPEGR